MNPTRAAFLAKIRATPDDDLPRLVYADWLDENGEPERATVIRLMVGGKRTKSGGMWPGTKGWKRVRSLASQFFSGLGVGGEFYVRPFRPRVHWHRGFVTCFDCDFAAWLTHAPAILAESVGLTVRLTDRPVLDVVGTPTAGAGNRFLYRMPDEPMPYENPLGMATFRIPNVGVPVRVPVMCGPDELPQQIEAWRRSDDMITMALQVNWPAVKTWELPPVPTRTTFRVAHDEHGRAYPVYT